MKKLQTELQSQFPKNNEFHTVLFIKLKRFPLFEVILNNNISLRKLWLGKCFRTLQTLIQFYETTFCKYVIHTKTYLTIY